MTGATRILKALVAKDLAVLAGRPLLWIVRGGFVAILSIAIAISWLIVGGDPADPASLPSLGRGIAVALFLSGYLCSLIAGPAMVVGALEDERSSGMLEILSASPLSDRGLMASLVLSRLASVAEFSIAALPLCAVPLVLGGVGPLEIVVRGIAPIAIGATLTTSYAVWRAACGDSLPQILWGIFIFVFATPLAPGFLSRRASIGLVFVAFIFRPLLIAVCPFYVLGAYAAGFLPIGLDIATLLFAGIAVIAAVGFLRLAGRSARGWVRGRAEPPRKAERHRYDADARRERIRALRALIAGGGGGAPPPPAEAAATASLRTPIARTAPAKLRALPSLAYQWTRGNPIVARHLARHPRRRRGEGVAIVWCAAGIWALTILVATQDRVNAWGSVAGIVILAGFAAAAAVACDVGARLLPPRTEAGFHETLASTPLRARDAIIGGGMVAMWRARIALLGVAAAAATAGAVLGRPIWPVAVILLFAALVGLAYGLALWARLVTRRPGEAVAASLGILVFLAVGSSLLVPASLRAAFNRYPYEFETFGAALAAGLPALGLIAAFALAFDRILRRPLTA